MEYITYTLKKVNRSEIRNEVVDLFKKELPGTGTGSRASKYTYEVESYCGYKILLKRPANLNKGFDFTVNVETPLGKSIFLSKSGKRRMKNPAHYHIIDILQSFKNSNENLYLHNITTAIKKIFNGESIDINNVNSIYLFEDYSGSKHPIEIILLAIKWLFIEQDITYWNWSGRAMLYSLLKENDLI